MDLTESGSEEEILMDPPTESSQAAASATANSLPEKSRSLYERAYKFFMDWRQENKTDSFEENILLEYFQKLSERMKPSSLWSIYSMLRTTINLKHNVDISKYSKLCEFLKRTSRGYKPVRSKTLTPQQIREFLLTAPDENYLFTKVGLIFGVMGACRREELTKIETSHVEDLKTALLVHIPDAISKTERQFVIGGYFYKICKKYMDLRPPNLVNITRFFLNYQKGKCTKQPIGINKFSSLACQVATFLKLSNPSSYTGHCLRRSSATVLGGSGAHITVLKRHRRWRATSVAGGYIDHSVNNKVLQTVENGEDNNIENSENIHFDIGAHKFEGRWTSAQIETLINEYRKYPVLYDIDTEDYSNPELRNQSLRNIVEALRPFRFGVTETEVVTQWNNLMIKYIHTQQQLQRIGKSELHEEPQFWYLQKLEFLKECVNPIIRNDVQHWENGGDPLASSVEIKEEIEERLAEADQLPPAKRLREQDSCSEGDVKSVKDENDIFGEFVASQLKKITDEEVRQDTILEIHNDLHKALKRK